MTGPGRAGPHGNQWCGGPPLYFGFPAPHTQHGLPRAYTSAVQRAMQTRAISRTIVEWRCRSVATKWNGMNTNPPRSWTADGFPNDEQE